MALLSGHPLRALDVKLPTSQYVIDRWGWEQGFPEETISAMAQSREGLLWIAHSDGLVRFNGTIATASQWPTAKTRDRSLRAMDFDRAGNLWAMTVTGSVVRVRAGAAHPPEGTSVEVVHLPDPRLRVPMARAGLVAMNQPGAAAVRFAGPDGVAGLAGSLLRIPPEDSSTALSFAPDGSFLMVAEGRVTHVHPGQGTQLVATLPPGPKVDRMLMGRSGRLWLRRRETLLCLYQGKVESWPLPEGFTNSSAYEPLVEDAHGTLWLGGRGGLVRFRQGQLEPIPLSRQLDETPVTALFEDREGALWVGMLTGELLRLRESPVSSVGRAEGLAGEVINSLLRESNGDVWTHAMNRGLTRQRGADREHFLIQNGNLWYSARDRASGDLVVGSGSVRYRLRRGARALEALPDRLQPRLGRITGWWNDPVQGGAYVSRLSGLYRQKSLLDDASAERISRQGDWRILVTGPNGWVWGSDSQQLVQWSPRGERVEWTPGHTSDELIHGLYWDEPTQRLWVGTNRGLLTWDPVTETWGPRGMEQDFFFDMQRDGSGALWVSTRNGILRLDPQRWQAGMREASLRLTHADGLRGLNFGMTRGQGAAKLPDGRILFASMHGLVALSPGRIPAPRFGPTPMITQLQADEATLPLGGQIRVAPGTSRVRISFEAFSISTPRPVAVSYRLDGVDTYWQPADSRRAVQYSNLGPGQYRFRLRSSWPDGSSREETSLAWEILPLATEQAWFRLGILSLLAAALWRVYLHRTRLNKARTDELERRVQDRTRELQAAKAAAEASANAKARFLATMSHEIRTPLNSIIGLSNLLAVTPLSGTQADYLHTLRSSGEMLLAIVNDVLDFSKIEEGKLTLDHLEFDVRATVDEAVELIAAAARTKGLRLEVSLPSTLPARAVGDPGRLKQVLLNLLSNAVKFTAEGSIRLGVTSEAEQGRDRYRFTVTDTGIGIAEEAQQQLFAVFSQADSSITRRFGGTGLGLAISERFVRMMSGEIGVHSRAGEGSTFWFSAVLERGTGEVAQMAWLQGRSAQLAGPAAIGLREQLVQLGVEVSLAETKEEVDASADVLFLDADWRDLAPALRARSVMLLLVSHEPDESDLVTPVSRRALLAALSRVLEGAPLTAPEPAPAHRGHVLLVEDNRINQKVATASLIRLGYSVDLAADGIQALASFQQHHYDVILMDCHMPRMDGFAATSAIRQLERETPREKRTPVIALTADVLESGRQQCFASGMDDFLSKPLHLDLLDQALTRWVSQR
ncbi:MAG: response regulator [Bryobacteraceae bacterium]|nr:response regulator [Bryobacteraceae bacterium]